jgi:hypothetical protein
MDTIAFEEYPKCGDCLRRNEPRLPRIQITRTSSVKATRENETAGIKAPRARKRSGLKAAKRENNEICRTYVKDVDLSRDVKHSWVNAGLATVS